MTRTKLVNGVPVPLSTQEDSARDAEEAAVAAAAPAVAAEAARLVAVDAAIAGDTQLQAVKSMTPTQLHTWITNNVTTLPQAIDLIEKLIRLSARKLL